MEHAEAAEAAHFIFTVERKLLEWAYQAADAFALYAGANLALRDRLRPNGDASQLADRYREPSVMMAVIRVYSMFDRNADVSFQAVKRKIENPEVQQLLVNNYTARASGSRVGFLDAECRESIERYLDLYSTLDVSVLKRLHHFRNIGLAHVSLSEVTKFVTYAEIEKLVRLAGSLASALTLAARSHNTSPVERMDSEADRLRLEWIRCIQRDLQAIKQGEPSTTLP